MSKDPKNPAPDPQPRRVDPDRSETEVDPGHPLRAVPEVDPETEARARAQACHEEIERVLQRHRCRLAPMLAEPEPVGNSGSTIQIRATYAVVPSILQPEANP